MDNSIDEVFNVNGKLRSYRLTRTQMETNGYPVKVTNFPGWAVFHIENPRLAKFSDVVLDRGLMQIMMKNKFKNQNQDKENHIIRRCTRCTRNFSTNAETGDYLFQEECRYHWGKKRDGRYECCMNKIKTAGCTTGQSHVWSGIHDGLNGPFNQYVETRPPPVYDIYGDNFAIFGLDCEMVYTKYGLELAKVSVVQPDGVLIYERLVKPAAEVIDHNTRFSGIRPEDYKENNYTTLAQVQQEILSFVHNNSILVGHALQNDLRALRIIHPNVIDTSIAYLNWSGAPKRHSLKELARSILNRDIQLKEHDSVEDACASIDLIFYKLELDMQTKYNETMYFR